MAMSPSYRLARWIGSDEAVVGGVDTIVQIHGILIRDK